jgi:ATP-binding cassette subfamily B multidrug efflux pump
MLKLFRLLKPYRFKILGILLLLFLTAMADLSLPTLLADIVNKGVVSGDVAYILRVGGLMVLIAVFGISCSGAGNYISSGVSLGFSRILRSRIFSKVESFSLHEFDAVGTSSLVTRTINDVTQVQQSLIMMLSIMVRAPIMCVGGIIMAVSRDAHLSIVFTVAIPVLAALIISIAMMGVPLFKEMQKRLDRLNMVVRERLSGIRVVRAFDREAHEKERFENAGKGLLETSLKLAGLMSAMMPIMMITMNFTMIAIIWFGGLRVDAGHMQVGDIMAFTQYVLQILFALMLLSMLFIVIPRAQASAIRINEVLEMNPEIKDPVKPETAAEVKGHVEFKNVSFRYHGAEQDAVSEVSFNAGPGEVTAIIGGTGSGKSTLVNLIPRFYDAGSGSVMVDGLDVRSMTQDDLRSRIGFVPQKAVLFTGTVKDNIKFGSNEIDDASLSKAAEIAQSLEFIEGMQDGFDSQISQGGINLSGGQKQRLSIARAVARKPEIYIFDDSFSALDFKTEAGLRSALKKETAGCTVIIVAQRVTSVMDADRIIVLDDGKIAGIGAHKELLESSEVYREIVYSQLSKEELS